MKKGKWRILVLAAMLALSGCSKIKDNQEDKQKATSVYETKDMKLGTNVMAVGEEEVTLNELLFYIYQIKSAYDGSLTTDVWNFKWNEEETIESYAKEEILEEIAQIKVICQQAKKEKCELTEEESNEAKVKAKDYVKALPSDASEYHLTDSLVEKIYLEHALAKKMYDVVAGTVDTNISDEEAKQVTIGYILVRTSGMDKNGNEVNLNEEQIKSAKKRAVTLQKQAKEQSDFVTFAQGNSDDETVEMTFSHNNGPGKFIDIAFSMEQNQVSDVIETEEGFYILCCLAPYDEAKTIEYKEKVIRERETEAFSKAYQTWKKEYKTVASSTLLDQISFDLY